MTRLILIATVFMLVSGPVGAKDAKGNYSSMGSLSCSQVLAAHANLTINKDGTRGDHKAFGFIGYIRGYATAYNRLVSGGLNLFPDMADIDIANWIASYCRSKPSHSIGNALHALTKNRGSQSTAPHAAAAPAKANGMMGLSEQRFKSGDVFRDCADCPEMVVIPSGGFMMGSPASEPGRRPEEGPQHQVTISKYFAVGKFEVTRAEWHSVMGGGYGDRQPVDNVSWNDAQAFVKKLSAKTGKHYRLLSEAEWEYAARAGTTTPFHTGDRISADQANFNGTETYNGSAKGQYRGTNTAVGSFSANAFGLHDMHGNVYEWVEDCFTINYSDIPFSGGSAWRWVGCPQSVIRGGSLHNRPRDIRSAAREGYASGERSGLNGFRIARTLF